METRRLPVVLVLLLLPVPAWADRHKMEKAAAVSFGSVTARGSFARRIWDRPYPNTDGKKGKESLFVFGELGAHVAGRGSGHRLEDGWVGLRYRSCGDCRIEPFGHLMVGGQYPSRPEGIDVDTDLALAGGVGFGFDLELDVHKPSGWVRLVRFQIDLVESSASPGFDHHGRVTIGFVFRKEPDDHPHP